MKRSLIAASLILIGITANASQWIKQPLVDNLTGLSSGDYVYAMSDNSVEVKQSRFSNQTIRTKASLLIFPKNIGIRLVDGGIIDCVKCKIRVLFGGVVDEYDVDGTDDNNSLYILDPYNYMKLRFQMRTMGATKIRVEVPFYKQGNEILDFNFIAPLDTRIYKQELKKK